jgi:epoxyqueuosine reductase
VNPQELRELVLHECARLGFHRAGVAPLEVPQRLEAFRTWLAAGRHGDMTYLAEPEHVEPRADPRRLLAGARSAVVVALAYPAGDPAPPPTGHGVIARYARGEDYHLVLKPRLTELADVLARAAGRPVAARVCVDSAPLLERDLAERAGVGFVAKNTMVIAPGLGSYLVLGELLLDLDIAPTAGGRAEPRCGSCRACLDACPTGAFPEPWVLDARRCISYLTIEHRGAIPRELRAALGTRVFGCDVCQEVCPFNAAAPARAAAEPALLPRAAGRGTPELAALLGLGAAQRRRFVRRSPLRRVGREELARNACVALGNAGDPDAVPALERALADPSPLVRGHAAWALGRLGAADVLARALAAEPDPGVRAELSAAASECGSPAPPPAPR